MQSINPFTSQIIGEYPEYSPAEVEEIITKVDRAFQLWKLTSIGQRAVCMKPSVQVARKEGRTGRNHCFGNGESET